jgi:hypothetical protein
VPGVVHVLDRFGRLDGGEDHLVVDALVKAGEDLAALFVEGADDRLRWIVEVGDRRALTFDASGSTPTTRWPRLAKQAVETAPT